MNRPVFFVGLHQPHDARHFEYACISINRLRGRKKSVDCIILLDSGAFTEIATYGAYRHDVAEYAKEIERLDKNNVIAAAVAQDYMCEPHMLKKTGLTIEDHQRLTIERYDALTAVQRKVRIMPVLQGYAPADYAKHVKAYGRRLHPNMWVGVGSVCKRNRKPEAIVEVLEAIRSVRSDLRLHGFGVKLTALLDKRVRALLYSADSMAWSFAARVEGRGPQANCWREAKQFADRINGVMELNNEQAHG